MNRDIKTAVAPKNLTGNVSATKKFEKAATPLTSIANSYNNNNSESENRDQLKSRAVSLGNRDTPTDIVDISPCLANVYGSADRFWDLAKTPPGDQEQTSKYSNSQPLKINLSKNTPPTILGITKTIQEIEDTEKKSQPQD